MSGTEELLVELTSFLAPTNRSDVRAMAAKHILEMTGGDLLAGGPKVRQIWENLAVPQLVKWLGDQDAIAHPCRDALVNLSANSLFFPTAPAIASKTQFWRWLIDEVKQSGPLLVNLSSLPKGADKIEEHIIGGTNRACAELLATCSVSKDIQVREWCLAAIRNLTVHEGARKGLAESSQSLRLLLEIAALGSTSSQRRDASGAIRNLLIHKDVGIHARALSADAGGWLTSGLVLGLGSEVCPSFADLNATLQDERNERVGMSPVLEKMFKGELAKRACMDPDKDHRDLLVDSLLLLATMKGGREKLRATKIYPAIRVYHSHEKEESISDKVFDLVDFLISEDDDDAAKEEDPAGSASVQKSTNDTFHANTKQVDATWSID